MFESTRTKQINALWQEGKTIKEINDEFHLITLLPAALGGVTKDTSLDFSKRTFNDTMVTVSRLTASGFYIKDDVNESSHALKYSTFKFLNLHKGK